MIYADQLLTNNTAPDPSSEPSDCYPPPPLSGWDSTAPHGEASLDPPPSYADALPSHFALTHASASASRGGCSPSGAGMPSPVRAPRTSGSSCSGLGGAPGSAGSNGFLYGGGGVGGAVEVAAAEGLQTVGGLIPPPVHLLPLNPHAQLANLGAPQQCAQLRQGSGSFGAALGVPSPLSKAGLALPQQLLLQQQQSAALLAQQAALSSALSQQAQQAALLAPQMLSQHAPLAVSAAQASPLAGGEPSLQAPLPPLGPRRALTKPGEGTENGGWDNEHGDLIVSVGDVFEGGQGHRYLVLDVLGQGTFGQVFRCQDLVRGGVQAVKVIKNQAAYFHQARVEIGVLQFLNTRVDPQDEAHIVRLRDFFVHRNHLCLCFELLHLNLYELVRQNRFRGFSLSLVRVFIAQVLQALCRLREARIIHCDLKPENVLLKNARSGAVKVIDFGSACFDDRTVYSYIQSRFYRSPEVVLGAPYTLAIDVWSLGCMAAELFLGLPLFPAASEHDLLSRVAACLGPLPDALLSKARNAHKFFSLHESPLGARVWTLRSREAFEAISGVPAPAGKAYFAQQALSDIVAAAPHRGLPDGGQGDPQRERCARACFADFLLCTLQADPALRWTPHAACAHPFITGEPWVRPLAPDAAAVPDPLPALLARQQQQQALVAAALQQQQAAQAQQAALAAAAAALQAQQALLAQQAGSAAAAEGGMPIPLPPGAALLPQPGLMPYGGAARAAAAAAASALQAQLSLLGPGNAPLEALYASPSHGWDAAGTPTARAGYGAAPAGLFGAPPSLSFGAGSWGSHVPQAALFTPPSRSFHPHLLYAEQPGAGGPLDSLASPHLVDGGGGGILPLLPPGAHHLSGSFQPSSAASYQASLESAVRSALASLGPHAGRAGGGGGRRGIAPGGTGLPGPRDAPPAAPAHQARGLVGEGTPPERWALARRPSAVAPGPDPGSHSAAAEWDPLWHEDEEGSRAELCGGAEAQAQQAFSRGMQPHHALRPQARAPGAAAQPSAAGPYDAVWWRGNSGRELGKEQGDEAAGFLHLPNTVERVVGLDSSWAGPPELNPVARGVHHPSPFEF